MSDQTPASYFLPLDSNYLISQIRIINLTLQFPFGRTAGSPLLMGQRPSVFCGHARPYRVSCLSSSVPHLPALGPSHFSHGEFLAVSLMCFSSLLIFAFPSVQNALFCLAKFCSPIKIQLFAFHTQSLYTTHLWYSLPVIIPITLRTSGGAMSYQL